MREIVETVVVDASPERVWEVLADLTSWEQWNPFIYKASGDLRVGGKLSLTMKQEGGRPITFKPTVQVLEPARRIEWLGRLLVPGIFDGRHSFTLEPADDGRTTVTQREVFTGALIPVMGKTLAGTKQSFAALNAALAERVRG